VTTFARAPESSCPACEIPDVIAEIPREMAAMPKHAWSVLMIELVKVAMHTAVGHTVYHH